MRTNDRSQRALRLGGEMSGHLALEGVRVLESARHLAGPFAGRLLATLGAEVVKAEPPEGDSLRGIAGGSLFAFLNAGKESVVVSDPGDLHRIAASADIWLDARPVDQIRASQSSLDTSLVHVAITPFGLTGPWAERQATSIVASAMGAFMHLCGDPSREPLRNGASLPEFQQGLFAAVAAVAALLAKESGRPGLIPVDISLLESVIAYQERADLALLHQGRDWVRSRRHEVGHPFTIFECAEGFVSLAVGTPRHWANLCVLMGKPEWGEDLDILMNRLAKADMIDEALVPWLRSKPAAEIVRECQEVFIPCGPVLTVDEVLADAHLAARGFFVDMEVPGSGSLTMPRSPLRAEWIAADLPPAPAIGQHTATWAGAAA